MVGGAEVRRRVCANLDVLGLRLNEARNAAAIRGKELDIAADESRIRVFAIPTDEARDIARQVLRIVADWESSPHAQAIHNRE